ncbi:MAG TPA: hypothetical protein VFB93_13670 [Burkholderiales bacterium]|nr:hypothetical protein [Burkholderiales bacterium]
MADYLRDELGKLLNEYDERRRAVLEREQKVRDDDARFVARFAELRRGVIRPAFEAAATMLSERGHVASITEQEFSVAEGAKVSEAWIALRIVAAGAKEENARSLSISTRHYNKMVWINAGKPMEGAKGTYPLEKIDRQRVEEELVKFVAGVVAG